MEKKSALMEVLNFCKLGKFKEGLNILNKLKEEISNQWITCFIVSCCSTCVANIGTPQNISPNDLHSFLTHIVSHIKCLTEAELLSYLQSIFHILKFFVQTKCYGLLAKMDAILLPSFLPSYLPAKHIHTFESSASLLHNFIIKTDYKDVQSLIQIHNTTSSIYARTSNAKTLLTTSLNCAIMLSGLSGPGKCLEDVYFNMLNLIKSHNLEVNSEDNFKNFLTFFCLIYQNMFKDFDFKSASTFHARTIEYSIKVFKKDDYTWALKLLKFPLILVHNFESKLEDLSECNNSLLNLDSVKKQLVGRKLNTILCSVVFSYYKSGNVSEWSKFSDSYQLELLRFIWDLSRIELLSKYSCTCKCLIEKNVFTAFTYSQFISKLLEIQARQKSTSNDFHKKSADLLIKFSKDVKTLKQYNCEKWKKTWDILGMALYIVGAQLHKNSNQGYLHYFHNLIKYFIQFEAQGHESVLKDSVISSVFTVLCDTTDYKKHMGLSALAIKLCPDQRDSFMVNWIKAKVKQREAKSAEADDIQKVTLVSAFTVFNKNMAFLTGGTNLLTTGDKIDLLVYELKQYKLRWKSKIPMMCALKELYEIADVTKIVQVILQIFGDCEIMLHNDVPKMLHDTLERYEKKISMIQDTPLEETVHLAFLYYMHYKYCVKDVIIKNTDDMERTMAVTEKADEPPDAIPKDPNEKCDIISFYESLKLSNYFEVMRYLNKSLDLFRSVITDNFNTMSFTTVSYSMLYNMLMKIAFEYRIHRHAVKSLQTLELALKVALSERNAHDIVWTISFIIENCDPKRSYVKYLTSTAEKQLDKIEHTTPQSLKVVLTYYICKAKSLLFDDYKEAYRIYETATELYDAHDDKPELQLVKSQLYLLHYKFALKPCNLDIVDHRTSTLLTIHHANAIVYEVHNTSKLDGPYEMSLLLSSSEEMAKLYHLLQCPREVRAYCKEIIVLAQRMVLPLQCAYYLVYLAHADLRSSRFDDCQVKVEGLADILCLTRPLYNVQADHENKLPQLCVDIEKDVVDLTNNMEEMVLDLPVSKVYKKQYSPSSPTLVVPSFHLPSFVYHVSDCDCFFCTSLEYQRLVLEKIRLDALLNVKQSNDHISTDFFHGAMNFYQQCSRKYEAYAETVSKMISYDLVPDLLKELLEVYGFTLLNYSSHLMRGQNKTQALKVTNRLIDLVSVKKLEYIYLYNAALFQKLDYLTEMPAIAPIENKSLEMDSLCPNVNAAPTTPESKQSKITFCVQYSPSYPSPKRRVKKCLPFNLSPSDDVPNNTKPKEKSSTSIELKAPAPKIKIYSNDSTEMKLKSTTKKIRDRKKLPVYEDPCSSIVSNEVSTPCSVNRVDTEGGLKTRTKLLTNKLRQSSKKPEPTDEKDHAVQEMKKSTLRKNLFEQGKVETGESTSRNGAIRRSARNRKI